jgi:hypothetical protein
MSHVRTQIRDAAKAALAAEFGDDATVYASRILPLEEADLPAILIYTNTEEIAELEFGGLDRTLTLVVECVAQGDDLDAALDPLLVGAESALNGSVLGGLVASLLPTAGLEVTHSAEGAAPTGRARLTFEARYCTSLADPETPI